jgi:hypothetical protein
MSVLLHSLIWDVTALYTHTHTVSTVTSSLPLLGSGFERRMFPNSPRPQLPASDSISSQRLNRSGSLTHSLTHSLTNGQHLSGPRYEPHKNRRYCIALQFFVFMYFLQSRYLATALVLLLISRSLPSIGSTCHNTTWAAYDNIEIRRNNVEDLKRHLSSLQGKFSEPKPKQLLLLRTESQKSRLRRRRRSRKRRINPLKMVLCLKNLQLWQAVCCSLNSAMKVKYAEQVKSLMYHELLSPEEWNV